MALSVPELTKSIDDAFAEEWGRRKPGIPLTSAGAEDRQLLFAAVARGVLSYLKAKERELLGSITVKPPTGESITEQVDRAVLNIETP